MDLRVTLIDGKSHSVDSSDMAFQSAGALALREAAEAAGVRCSSRTTTSRSSYPMTWSETAMSDLSARRGRLLGTDKSGDDRTLIRAQVPPTELERYAIDLRSSTHGTGTFTRAFAHYEPLPEDVARVSPEGERLDQLVARPLPWPLAEVGGDERELLDRPGRTGVPVEQPDPAAHLAGRPSRARVRCALNRPPSASAPAFVAAARAPVASRSSSVPPRSSASRPAHSTRARPGFGNAPPPATPARTAYDVGRRGSAAPRGRRGAGPRPRA